MAAVLVGAAAPRPRCNDHRKKKGVKAKEKRGLRRSAADPPLCPLSGDYPLSWGRTEGASEAEYEQHGKEQLTIAQTP